MFCGIKLLFYSFYMARDQVFFDKSLKYIKGTSNTKFNLFANTMLLLFFRKVFAFSYPILLQIYSLPRDSD